MSLDIGCLAANKSKEQPPRILGDKEEVAFGILAFLKLVCILQVGEIEILLLGENKKREKKEKKTKITA